MMGRKNATFGHGIDPLLLDSLEKGFLHDDYVYAAGASNGAYYEKGKIIGYPYSLYGRIYDGPYTNYYRNGNICIETNFIKGIVNGYTKKYYENGSVELQGFIYSWDIETSIEIIYGLDMPLWGPDPLYYVKGQIERFYENGKLEAVYYGDDCDILNLKQIYPK